MFSIRTLRRQAQKRGDKDLLKRLDDLQEAKRLHRKVTRLIRKKSRSAEKRGALQ